MIFNRVVKQIYQQSPLQKKKLTDYLSRQPESFFEEVRSPTENGVMCYPYGAYNNFLIDILKKKNFKLGLTTKVYIAGLSKENAFTLERLDTNDLPKASKEREDLWTKKV